MKEKQLSPLQQADQAVAAIVRLELSRYPKAGELTIRKNIATDMLRRIYNQQLRLAKYEEAFLTYQDTMTDILYQVHCKEGDEARALEVIRTILKRTEEDEGDETKRTYKGRVSLKNTQTHLDFLH